MATVLAGVLYARHALATTFKMYDDEGYVLLSLGHYLRGGHLYTEVFSQYGPFYFFVQAAIFRLLHLPVTHDAGRLVTLLFWLASAALGGYCVYRISRDAMLAFGAGLALMPLLRELSFEPGHPQDVILLLLMASCAVAAAGGNTMPGLLGAFGAALVFTKINVGVFFLAAVGHALLCRLPASRTRSMVQGIALLFAVGVPVLLMRRHVPGMAAGFCLAASVCGAATFGFAGLKSPASTRPGRDLLSAAAGAVLTGLLISVAAVIGGMPATALLEGVILGPLRHPGVFSVVLEVPGLVAILAVIVAGFVFRWGRSPALGQGGVEIVEALQFWTGLCAIPLMAISAKNGMWVLPFLPLGMMRIHELPPAAGFGRVFLACLSAMEFLQVYPVAGTQLAIAASPLMLWAFVCVHDGAGGFVKVVRKALFGTGAGVRRVPSPGMALALGFLAALAGTEWLHLPADREAGYRRLTELIRANCDVLFTLPGMGSFNLWSGVPTPNGLNLTAWVKGFNAEQQQQILDILRAHPRACAVYSDEMSRGWQVTPEEIAASPLARYVLQDMPKVAEDSGYEIRVQPQRTFPWVARVPDGVNP